MKNHLKNRSFRIITIDLILKNNVDQLFLNNCMTVESYLNDFVNESIDYKKYYNDTCKIRGTYFNSEGPMSVEYRKSAHKEMWAKYDFISLIQLFFYQVLISKLKKSMVQSDFIVISQ